MLATTDGFKIADADLRIRGPTNPKVGIRNLETIGGREHGAQPGFGDLTSAARHQQASTRPGTCLLVARGGGEVAEARLRAMLATTDGFKIADADLRIRGPGEFLGTKQSGVLPDLRIADLIRDARLISVAREAALDSVRADPGLATKTELRRAVDLRWGDRLSLMGVG